MDKKILDKKKKYDYEKLNRIVRYIHHNGCRHKYILDYFEDNTDSKNQCEGMCDNCIK